MPTIRLTDQLGVALDVKTPPMSTFAAYAKQAPQLLAGKLDLARARGLILRDPAMRAFQSELAFAEPVELGAGGAELTFGAGVQGGFQVIQRDPELPTLAFDEFGEEIEIPVGTCYFSVTLGARVSAGVAAGTGALSLGFGPEAAIEAVCYRSYPEETTLSTALADSIGGFTVPSRAEDLARIPEGGLATVTGTGTLSFTATANLLAVANPLATASLPAGLPSLSVVQSGSLEVEASYNITGEHQVRAHRAGPREVLLGWYRKRGRELAVTAEARAGVSAGIGELDLVSRLVRAISKDAAADFSELRAAGLSAGQTDAMQSAVREAVNRKLQLAISAGLSTGDSHGAAFLYRIDPEALDERGRAAVTRALGGDLSDLAGAALPAGITEVHSILRDVREARHSLNVNLLGIYNYGSVSSLMREGSVMFTPSTGELVIADSASSETIRSGAVNFGADEEKLRRLLFGSLMITAAYTGAMSGVGEPALSCAHLYFILKADARRADLRRYMRALSALGLAKDPDGALPVGLERFGRTTLLARVTYDGAVARGLFVTAAGEPRPVEDYEDAGRHAFAALLLPDSEDAFRLRPMQDDALWKRMKAHGPPNRFGQLFADDFQAAQVAGDYLLIRWWADAMHSMGTALARLRQWFAVNPSAPQDNAQFQKLREALADRIAEVVRRLPAERWSFQVGEPWGLVALFLASGGTAGAEAKLVSPLVTRMEERAIHAAAGT